MGLFTRESYLGIDIGTSVVKVAEISLGKKPVLKNYAYTNFENNLVFSKGSEAITEAVKKIGEVLDAADIKTNKAVMSLPGFSVFTTILELPMMPAEDLKKAIEYESKYYIPLPLEEVVLGWQFINPPEKPSLKEKISDLFYNFSFLIGVKKKEEEKPKKKIQVFVTAAPVDLVKKYSQVGKLLGLKLFALEAEVFAMIRTLAKDSKDPFLIVDLGAHATNVSVVDNGYLQLTHGIDTGGESITQAVARGMGIDFQRAEEFKIRYGIYGNSNSGLEEIIKSVFSVIKKELAHLVKMYYNKSGREIKRAILIGGSANLKGLPEYFRKEVGLAASVGDPFSGINYPEVLRNRLYEIGPSFSVAVGLALRNIVSRE